MICLLFLFLTRPPRSTRDVSFLPRSWNFVLGARFDESVRRTLRSTGETTLELETLSLVVSEPGSITSHRARHEKSGRHERKWGE
jgi:hypothetical protein